MRIVLDANIIIAGLMGSKGTIVILTSQNHSFYAPKKIVDEIRKYKKEICEFINQTSEEFEIDYKALLIFINLIDFVEYEKFMDKAKEVIRDVKDADYIACGLAVKADFIWSNDKDFKDIQQIIAVKTTEQFIEEGKLN
ncbi:MAG: PIN domain-containing protein [Candidatus Nanoarchaeia archaeon]|nr:PIN domain-containing protein [Candidatus Nanoarchaeia archaeon]